jgi:hypothetical protein
MTKIVDKRRRSWTSAYSLTDYKDRSPDRKAKMKGERQVKMEKLKKPVAKSMLETLGATAGSLKLLISGLIY